MKQTNIEDIFLTELSYKLIGTEELKARFVYVSKDMVELGEYNTTDFPWSERTKELFRGLIASMQEDVGELIFTPNLFEEQKNQDEERKEKIEDRFDSEDPFKG